MTEGSGGGEQRQHAMTGNDATRAGRGARGDGEGVSRRAGMERGRDGGPDRQHRPLVVANLCGTNPLIYCLQIKELIYVGNVTQFKYKTK